MVTRPRPNGLGTISKAPGQISWVMPVKISIPPRANVVTVTRGHFAMRPVATQANRAASPTPSRTARMTAGALGHSLVA